MPDPHLLPAFVLATTVLMLIPGPNVALIVANSVAYGARRGLLTVAGTAGAGMVQLALVSLGMTELLRAAGAWFELVRWMGVVYLVVLGVQQWRAPVLSLSGTGPQPRAMFVRAMLVSLSNPKTLLFYGAFFPQFVSPERPAGPQFMALAAIYLLVAVLIDGGWALLAARARGMLSGYGRLRNRVTGGLLVGAGVGLALARPK